VVFVGLYAGDIDLYIDEVCVDAIHGCAHGLEKHKNAAFVRTALPVCPRVAIA
jgi:hypothetical protein